MLRSIIFIGVGGFAGSIARFLVSKYVQNIFISAFPWGTFVVNIAGCLLIGLLYGISERGTIFSSELRLFLTVGFCGAFTTFSTFANENVGLLRDGEFYFFMLYTGLSIFLGLTATFFGFWIVKIA